MLARSSTGCSCDALLLVSLLLSSVAAQVSMLQLSQFSRWPDASVASASSTHDPSGDGTTFHASNAIDGDITTRWNDDTIKQFPDTLLITTPQSVTLTGLVILSADDGWLTSYSVDTATSYTSSQFVTAASVYPDTKLSNVTFDPPLALEVVRITVESSSKGDFSRIFEVYPIFAEQIAPTTSSTNTTATGTQNSLPKMSSSPPSSPSSTSSSHFSSWQTSRTVLLVGDIVIGIGAIMLVAGLVFFLLRRRRNRGGVVQKAEIEESWSGLEHNSKSVSEYAPYTLVQPVSTVELGHATPIRLAHNNASELA